MKGKSGSHEENGDHLLLFHHSSLVVLLDYYRDVGTIGGWIPRFLFFTGQNYCVYLPILTYLILLALISVLLDAKLCYLLGLVAGGSGWQEQKLLQTGGSSNVCVHTLYNQDELPPTATVVVRGRQHHLEKSDHDHCHGPICGKVVPHSVKVGEEYWSPSVPVHNPISQKSMVGCCLVRNETTVLRHSSIIDW